MPPNTAIAIRQDRALEDLEQVREERRKAEAARAEKRRVVLELVGQRNRLQARLGQVLEELDQAEIEHEAAERNLHQAKACEEHLRRELER